MLGRDTDFIAFIVISLYDHESVVSSTSFKPHARIVNKQRARLDPLISLAIVAQSNDKLLNSLRKKSVLGNIQFHQYFCVTPSLYVALLIALCLFTVRTYFGPNII